MATLIFDIETVGEDFDSLDSITQEVLTRWIKKESLNQEEYKKSLEELKERLGFAPFTGEIVVIGLLDNEKNQGIVYFQAPEEKMEPFQEKGIKFKQLTEKEMLEKFWRVANQYQEFVSFNGRVFDVPFLMIRSAVHSIRPTKNLIASRYLSGQKEDAKHIDLLEQLTFYGAFRRRGNLHLWCRAFGIKSPKADGLTGDDIGRLFKERKFLDIAKYNLGDLQATKELYNYWKKYLSF